MSHSERLLPAAIQSIDECPYFQRRIHTRSVYEDVQDHGLLHKKYPAELATEGLSSATNKNIRLFEEVADTRKAILAENMGEVG